MSSYEQTNSADVPSSVQHGTDAFEQALDHLLSDEEEEDTGPRILFHDGTREKRHQALATITQHDTANVHQFHIPSLLADQRMQTQNNLRKAFDHAAEERALVFFDSADAVFTHSHIDSDEDEDRPEPSTAEYFIDRVVAYLGVVVLAFQKQSHVQYAREYVDLVVEFE